MKTSELVNELVDSLKYFGDLPTNINDISWYSPYDNGEPESINLVEIDDRELENKEE